jgi:mannitol/fructose-specific phosphotransferase system IIA component (Ntr-type)
VPEDCGEDHLKLLAQVAELFSDSEVLEGLREAETPAQILQLLSGARH